MMLAVSFFALFLSLLLRRPINLGNGLSNRSEKCECSLNRIVRDLVLSADRDVAAPVFAGLTFCKKRPVFRALDEAVAADPTKALWL